MMTDSEALTRRTSQAMRAELLVPTADKALAKRVTEFLDLRKRASAAASIATGAEDLLRVAESADRQAAAEAVLAGNNAADVGTPHQDEAKAKVAAADVEFTALSDALEATWAELRPDYRTASQAEEDAARTELAARRADVPATVLYAVALQESGTKLRGRLIPWPWTLNVAGAPQRYATRTDACAGLHRALAHTPAKRIDAGLGQVNLGYHTHRYTQPCELLDPYRNLAIAAEILREQHTPGEDWLLAIGRYHRPAGGAPAARYRRSVHRHLTRVLDPDVPVPTLQATTP